MKLKERIDNIEEFKQIIENEPYYQYPLLPFSQEDDFKELFNFFKGKRVAIVGPAPDLIGKNKGKEIDDYDIVCKVGSMYNIDDPKNYGSRCDVLFNGCFPNHYNIEDYNNHDIKRIICPIKCCIPNILDIHKRDIYGFYKNLQSYYKDISFNNISLFSCQIDNIMKTRSTLGSFSILFLLNMDLDKLGIFGFTWLFGKDQYNKQYHNFNKRIVNPHGTNMEIEARFINSMIKKSNINIICSSEVKNILNKFN